MQVVETIQEMRDQIKQYKRNTDITVGFVPTMGFLHAGHASLLQRAREECDVVVLSIFINPIQFGPNEDYERYPRDPLSDLALAGREKVDFVFMPQVSEMYPQSLRVTLSISQLTDRLCGASRPGHFDGVATVVAKLFHIIEPDKAYFGLKDAQQIAVITQMINDLNMNTAIVPCPIIREPDGLAMSSRNVYLQQEERRQAVVLSQALQHTEEWLRKDRSIPALEQKLRAFIARAPLAKIEYATALAYPSLTEIDQFNVAETSSDPKLIVALAVRFGQTRLIDNRIF